MRPRSILALLILLITPLAQAHRAVVIFRSEAYYQQNRVSYERGLLDASTASSRRLDQLHALVIDAADVHQLARWRENPQVASVVEERFFPLPTDWKVRPAAGNRGSPVGMPTTWGVKAIHAPEAWALSKSGEGARVMILDTGIDATHPFLRENFEQGKNFFDQAHPEDFKDQVGHGTHIAGTIAGVLTPAGFSGVAPKAKILMGRVCDEKSCSTTAVLMGINWAMEQNVDVLSMSFGAVWGSAEEKDALRAATQKGIVAIAAAGNGGFTEGKLPYPASYDSVIAVGAVDANLQKADFSQWGIHLAPG